MRRVHYSLIMLATALTTVATMTSATAASGTAIGTWDDTGTNGIARTKIVESSCVSYGTTFVCSLSAVAEQRATNPPRQGTCTDTTFTLAGSSFAGPCRAAFGARVAMERTGSPAMCNGSGVMDGTMPNFQYTNAQGINSSLSNLSVHVVNNRVTIDGSSVDIDGNPIRQVTATFPILCRNNTHYGGWQGTFEYVV